MLQYHKRKGPIFVCSHHYVKISNILAAALQTAKELPFADAFTISLYWEIRLSVSSSTKAHIPLQKIYIATPSSLYLRAKSLPETGLLRTFAH